MKLITGEDATMDYCLVSHNNTHSVNMCEMKDVGLCVVLCR